MRLTGPPVDLDHVVLSNGEIFRVVGNLADDQARFLGYNVYSPDVDGDRLYQDVRYKKNYVEDENLPSDVLDTYQLVPVSDVVERHDPVQSAIANSRTFRSTPWFDLYLELVRVFGREAVGIFGSAMFGFHKTPSGGIRKDVDFVIQGIDNVPILQNHLPQIRDATGFTAVTPERQLRQYERYRRVFRNENNTIRAIIERRWTGLQLSEDVVSTIRLRDATKVIPAALVMETAQKTDDFVVSGRVLNSAGSNLFPRNFTIVTEKDQHLEIFIFWWKFSTPVREGDSVRLCGSLVTLQSGPALRLTSFTRHWLKIHE